jgi:hypothetical protein
MVQSGKAMLILTVIMTVAAIVGCDLKKEVNEATKETEPFEQKLEDMPITGLTQEMPGLCSPAVVTFNELMSTLSWWSDAQGHLDDVTIETLDYMVKSNQSSSQATVYLYLSEVTDISQVSDADYLGATNPIPAGTNVENWTPLLLKPGAEKRLENLIINPDTEFTICARVPEVVDGTIDPGSMNLKLSLQIAGNVTFVPLEK